MLNFDGSFQEIKKKLVKDGKSKIEMTHIKVETLTFSEDVELRKQMPKLAKMILDDDSGLMIKGEFNCPDAGNSLTITHGEDELSISPLKSMKVGVKYSKDDVRILTFDISYKSGDNPLIDKLLGYLVNINI